MGDYHYSDFYEMDELRYENNELKRQLAKCQADLKSVQLCIKELESELEQKEDGENNV